MFRAEGRETVMEREAQRTRTVWFQRNQENLRCMGLLVRRDALLTLTSGTALETLRVSLPEVDSTIFYRWSRLWIHLQPTGYMRFHIFSCGSFPSSLSCSVSGKAGMLEGRRRWKWRIRVETWLKWNKRQVHRAKGSEHLDKWGDTGSASPLPFPFITLLTFHNHAALPSASSFPCQVA